MTKVFCRKIAKKCDSCKIVYSNWQANSVLLKQNELFSKKKNKKSHTKQAKIQSRNNRPACFGKEAIAGSSTSSP